MLIDIHTHCFPHNIAAKAIPLLAQRAGVSPAIDGTIEALKKSMIRAAVDKSMIAPIATQPDQTATINRWAVGVQDHQIISFGTVHPDYLYWDEEITWLVNQEIKGIKFHPDYQNFYVDDQKMFPIYEKICEAGLVILFHAGIDIGLGEPCHCPPKRLRKVLNSFPGLKIIAAHMGGYLCWEEVEKFLVGKNLYLDTSFSFHKLGPANMERIIKNHGPAKILFGTDSPWGDQSQEIAHLKSLHLTSDELAGILGENAKCLLDL